MGSPRPSLLPFLTSRRPLKAAGRCCGCGTTSVDGDLLGVTLQAVSCGYHTHSPLGGRHGRRNKLRDRSVEGRGGCLAYREGPNARKDHCARSRTRNGVRPMGPRLSRGCYTSGGRTRPSRSRHEINGFHRWHHRGSSGDWSNAAAASRSPRRSAPSNPEIRPSESTRRNARAARRGRDSCHICARSPSRSTIHPLPFGVVGRFLRRLDPHQDGLIERGVRLGHAARERSANAAAAVAYSRDGGIRNAEPACNPGSSTLLVCVLIPVGSRIHGHLCVTRSCRVCITRSTGARGVSTLRLTI